MFVWCACLWLFGRGGGLLLQKVNAQFGVLFFASQGTNARLINIKIKHLKIYNKIAVAYQVSGL